MMKIAFTAIALVFFSLPTYSQRNARSLSDHIKTKKEKIKIDKGTTTITISTPYTDTENYQQFSDMLFDKGYFFEKEDERRGYLETEKTGIGKSVDVQYYLRIKIANQSVIVTPYVYRTGSGVIANMVLDEPMAYGKIVGSRKAWPKIVEDVSTYCECKVSYSE